MNEPETATATVRQEAATAPLEPTPGPGLDVAGPPAPLPGVFAAIGALPPGAIVTENALAKLFQRHPASIRRAAARGELPAPARLLGGNCWTAGAIVRHIEGRMTAAAKEAEKINQRISALRP